MNNQTIVTAFALALTVSTTAHAADNDITIRMMENNESTQDSITRVISLPEVNKNTLQIQAQQQLQNKNNKETNATPDETQLQLREMEMQQDQQQEQLREMEELQLQLDIQHTEQTQVHVQEPQSEPATSDAQTPDAQGMSNNASHP